MDAKISMWNNRSIWRQQGVIFIIRDIYYEQWTQKRGEPRPLLRTLNELSDGDLVLLDFNFTSVKLV